eukprot:CAMPEP_0197629368 /NCGR_PEP_ID=MMETSP1338-20131121/7250_1 /TAXON_ID=43686 ORGANISM="Pelagodinium beii, Strain RCC1491" /NCGR_SAMPLE_ID=MMETSP1338 /ASSEMBLY_ACC=CAM_ASM_000754 /LENGTH=489 /DNA_ID=CAMNT_0043200403 /DNA_START=21 /DNA_END=1490 /DNA_ORIENTATION=-
MSAPAGAETAPQAEKPSLAEVVERIGFGGAQLRAAALGGSVWLADGSELLLISSVTKAVAEEWDLSAFTQGLVVTVVFCGILLGNLSSGPGGSYFGRRQMIVASYTGIFAFSIFCAWSANIFQLIIWRFIVGYFIGLGQPAWLAISAEVTPSAWRLAMGSGTQALFVLGEIYSCFLMITDDPTLQALHWRWLLALGALPSLVMALASFAFLLQSPTFLAMQGRYEDAREVLVNMRDQNGAEDIALEFKMPSQPESRTSSGGFFDLLGRQLKVITGNKLFFPTVVVMYSCFMVNLAYYGCLFAFPQVLAELMESGAASQLLVGALWELPGMVAGFAIGVAYFRKTGLKFYLTLQTSFLLLFVIAAKKYDAASTFHNIILYISYYGIKLCPQIGFVLLYQVANEIYPTEARTTGCAMCMAGGRVASMTSPLIYEAIVQMTGSWLWFFLIMAAGCILNLYVLDIVPETANALLSDDIEDQPGVKLHGDKAND